MCHPLPRHIELFTTAADAKILPELHGQRLSKQNKKARRKIPPRLARFKKPSPRVSQFFQFFLQRQPVTPVIFALHKFFGGQRLFQFSRFTSQGKT